MKTFTLRLEEDLLKEMRKLCIDKGISANDFIRTLIKKALEDEE